MIKPIKKFSNPIVVNRRWKKYKDKEASALMLSPDPEKKYMVITPDKRIVNFGQMGYEDWTKHLDPVRRKAYLSRANGIKGDWRSDKYSPNNLAINLLW
jgi:hypothetical protein